MARLGSLPLLVQSTGGYKVLVAITLNGGNDGNSILLPLKASDFAGYTRGRAALALAQDSLLPISAGGVAYGINPAMKPLTGIYSAGRLAFVANMGNLIQPTKRVDVLGSTGLLPDGLDGHDGQINEFFAANGSATANVGWGGMMADQLSTSGGTLPPLISLAEASVFTNGLTPSSMLLSGPPVTGFSGFDNSVASQARLAAPQAITACHCRLRLSTR